MNYYFNHLWYNNYKKKIHSIAYFEDPLESVYEFWCFDQSYQIQSYFMLKFEKSNSHNISPKKTALGFFQIKRVFWLMVTRLLVLLTVWFGAKHVALIQQGYKQIGFNYHRVLIEPGNYYHKSIDRSTQKSYTFKPDERVLLSFKTILENFTKASNCLAYASLSEQMVLPPHGAHKSIGKARVVSFKQVYHNSLVERQIGFVQTLANPLIRPVVSLKAIYCNPLPDIEPRKPIPVEFLTNQYDTVFKSYTYGKALEEFAENYKKFKPYFYAAVSQNGPMLYDLAEKLLSDHLSKSMELYDTTEPEIHFPYQGCSEAYEGYRAELVELDKIINEKKSGYQHISKEILKKEKIDQKAQQREIMMKYKPRLKHLHYGLIGIDSQGKEIFNKKLKRKFNRLVKQAALELKLPAPSLLVHHIDPQHTSNKNSNGEPNELGLDIPDGLVESDANQVVQFALPNQLTETLTDFSLKNIPKQERDHYCFGEEVYAYVQRNNLNPPVPGRAKVEPQSENLLLATTDETKKDYLKQEESIKRTRHTYRRIDEVLNEADQTGNPKPMAFSDQQLFERNKVEFKRLVEEKEQYFFEQKQQLKKK